MSDIEPTLSELVAARDQINREIAMARAASIADVARGHATGRAKPSGSPDSFARRFWTLFAAQFPAGYIDIASLAADAAGRLVATRRSGNRAVRVTFPDVTAPDCLRGTDAVAVAENYALAKAAAKASAKATDAPTFSVDAPSSGASTLTVGVGSVTSRFSVLSGPAPAPAPALVATFTVPAPVLRELVRLADAAPKVDPRKSLIGLNLAATWPDDGPIARVVATATDGKRLFRGAYQMHVERADGNVTSIEVTIPRDALLAAASVLSGGKRGNDVPLVVGLLRTAPPAPPDASKRRVERQPPVTSIDAGADSGDYELELVIAADGNAVIRTAPAPGMYPRVSMVIPNYDKAKSARVVVPTSALADALKPIVGLARADGELRVCLDVIRHGRDLRVRRFSDGLTSAKGPEIPIVSWACGDLYPPRADAALPDMTVCLNVEYLLDCLDMVEAPFVEIESRGKTPALLHGLDPEGVAPPREGADYVVLLMPIASAYGVVPGRPGSEAEEPNHD